MPWRRSRLALIALPGLAATLLTSACGALVPGANSTVGQPQNTVVPTPAKARTSYGMLSLASSEIGMIVTDANGNTLYRFDKDRTQPPTTTCVDACATQWPPVPAEDSVMVSGVDPTLVTSLTRPDGTEQMVLAGWPLYRFARDKKAGDVLGQGSGGTWWAATPEGKKAGAAASAPATTSQPAASSAGAGGTSQPAVSPATGSDGN
jgi:predicted lipoprotein with Yx(FWY)xxD motif